MFNMHFVPSWTFLGPLGPLAFGRNIFDFLGWLLILILPFIILFILFDRLFSSDGYVSNKNILVELLKERYAQGDISKEEFQQKLHDLGNLSKS